MSGSLRTPAYTLPGSRMGAPRCRGCCLHAHRSVFNVAGHPGVADGKVALNVVQRKASVG